MTPMVLLVMTGGKCRDDPSDQILKHDCYAHSTLLTLGSNSIRALEILTDTQCSCAQFLADATLMQAGGDTDGIQT